VLYPALHSIRAIQSADEDDDKHWLTYWMIFGLFNFMDTFAGFILNCIPYWAYVRLILFSWLMLPQFKGAKWLYESFIREAMENNREKIQEIIKKTGMEVAQEEDEIVEEEETIVIETAVNDKVDSFVES
jgi:receptor expression-enhancing protein 5/6